MKMELKDYFKKGKFYVWKGSFAIVKSKKPLRNAFAVIKDKNEITVIIDEFKIKNNKNIVKAEKGWKIITFDITLPFGLVGFLAKISKIMADKNISIFAISAYSTDHILVKEKDIGIAIRQLKNFGLRQNEPNLQ